MLKKTILLLIVFLLVGFWVYAETAETSEIKEQMKNAGVEALNQASEGAKEFDPEFDFEERVFDGATGEIDRETGTDILEKTFKFFLSALKNGISETAKIMLSVFVFGIILKFLPEGISSDAAFFAAYAVLFSMALYIFQDTVIIAGETIEQMNFLVKAAIPVMCTLSVPAGKFASSAGTAAIIGGICVVTETAARFLMPLTSMMAAISAANNLSGDMSLRGLEKLIRKVVMWSVGIATTIFVSLIKIRGITGSSLDNVTGKTIKFAVGNMVPVVGGIISDSLDSIISYSGAVKSSCGAVGVLALIYITIPPVMKIAGMLLAFRLTGIVSSPVADGRINGAIESFSDILGIVLIVTVVVCILFLTAMGSFAI